MAAERAEARPDLVSPGRKPPWLLSRELDQREQALAAIEDWNLLYVAATRARRGLVVSAQPGANVTTDSWYERLQSLPVPDAGSFGLASDSAAATHAGSVLAVPGLHLPPLPTGTRRAERLDGTSAANGAEGQGAFHPAVALARAGETTQVEQAMKAGIALHFALEHLAAGMSGTRVAEVLAQQALLPGIAARALSLALAVRRLAVLRPAFDSAASHDELELYDASGQLMRIDRLSRVGNELWIIDYKWSVEPIFRRQYAAQLAGYRRAIADLPQPPLFDGALFDGLKAPVAVRTVLVDAVAATAEFDIDRSPQAH